jgi:hypothetical protein
VTKDKTSNIDWKTLCKDLLNELESLPCETNYRGENRSIFPVDEELLYRARESLAQAERCSGTKDLNEEEVAKVIYRESYYAFGFDSFPPKWEELGDCLVRQCCRDAARVIMTRWYHN